MLTDIWTVVQKEFKEIIHQRGNSRSGWISILLVVGILGIYMPLLNGREWVTTPIGPISFGWLPLFLVLSIVADGFAGERERHTLETLLASRLSDRAILYGKLATAILYSAGITLASLLLGGVVANLNTLQQGFVFYPLGLLGAMLLFSLLLSILVSAAGTLVSLHASSVRQASQQLSLSMLGVWVVFFLALRFLPASWKAGFSHYLAVSGFAGLLWVALAALLLIDLALLAVARLRFERTRLILD